MVSIVVPVYNSEKYLERCIESILVQTYSDIELILIDDGSGDRSAQICEKYVESDKRVRLSVQKNSGVSITRNRGIALAQGDYIQFVDSDDYIEKTMVEELVSNIEYTKADLVICGCTEVHPDHMYTLTPDIEDVISVCRLKEDYPDIFERFLLNSPCNKLYKTRKIKKYFPEDLSLGEDLLFNLEYIRGIDTISFLKRNLYYYDIHSQSLNRKYRKDSIEIAETLYLESMRFSKEFELGQSSAVQISNIFIRFLLYGLSDLYSFSGYEKKRQKEILKKWVENEHVQDAAKIAQMGALHQRIAQFLIRHKKESLLVLLFEIKRKMRNLVGA